LLSRLMIAVETEKQESRRWTIPVQELVQSIGEKIVCKQFQVQACR